MHILVRFEDKYGAYDLASHKFGIPFMTKNDTICPKLKINNIDVTIERGLSTQGIFRKDTVYKDADIVIFVYDMDKLIVKAPVNYIDSSQFEERMKDIMSNEGNENTLVLFVPTIFCSETIMLHKLDPNSVDFSETFSDINTASMHYKILEDALKNIHTDTEDKIYWKHHGKNSKTLKVKETRLFLNDGYTIENMIHNLRVNGFSRFNKAFLNWLDSGNITDTSMLLDFNEALKQQKEFERAITSAIQSKNTGLTYNSVNYT